jgi:hypothetical protein
MPKNDHLAAMEQPELLAQDIRDFFRTLGQRREFRGWSWAPRTSQAKRATIELSHLRYLSEESMQTQKFTW